MFKAFVGAIGGKEQAPKGISATTMVPSISKLHTLGLLFGSHAFKLQMSVFRKRRNGRIAKGALHGRRRAKTSCIFRFFYCMQAAVKNCLAPLRGALPGFAEAAASESPGSFSGVGLLPVAGRNPTYGLRWTIPVLAADPHQSHRPARYPKKPLSGSMPSSLHQVTGLRSRIDLKALQVGLSKSRSKWM